MINHVIFQRDLSRLVANDGEGQIGATDLVNIFDPLAVAVDRVGRQADQLDAAACELGLELCEGA